MKEQKARNCVKSCKMFASVVLWIATAIYLRIKEGY